MDVLVSMLCFKIAIFLCSGVSGFLIDSSNSPLKNPVATQSSHRTLSSSVLCSNKLPRCEVYGRTVCSSYVTWAKVNCPLYCGLCTASPTTTLPSSTTKTVFGCLSASLGSSVCVGNTVFCFVDPCMVSRCTYPGAHCV
uniref:Uncharacterized protein n=1 Tax=Magallana gigas TaxID=29159 RepID=K1PLW2_MAGGI